MKDDNKTKKQLIAELNQLRRKIEGLQSSVPGTVKTGSPIAENIITKIYETSPVGITYVNKNGEIIHANEEAEKILGLKKSKITHLTYNAPDWKITDYEGNPFPNKNLPFSLVKKHKKPFFDVRHAIQWPNGRRVLLSINANPLLDEKGRFEGMIAAVTDVTERVREHQELEESEKRFRSFFKDDKSIKLIIDPGTGSIIDASNSALAYYGYTLEELTSMKIQQINQLSKKEVKKEMDNARKREKSYFNFRHALSDGTIRDVEVYSTPIKIKGCQYLFSIIHDITDRKDAEQKLSETREFTNTIINAQIDTLFVFDPGTGKAVMWNRAFEEISGYTFDEIEKQTAPNSYYSVSDLEKAAAFIPQVIKEGKGRIELDLVCKDGNTVPTEYEVSVIRDRSGKPELLISIGRDISDRRMAMKALEASESHLKDAQSLGKIGHWVLNARDLTVEGSDELFNIFDLSREEANLDAFAGVVHPDDRDYDLYHINRGLTEGIPWDIEHRLVCRNGSEKTIRAMGKAIIDDRGNITELIGTVQDITEQTRVRRALEKSEEQYRAVVEEQTQVIARFLPDGTLTFVNGFFCRFFDKTREDLIGRSWTPEAHPDDVETVNSVLAGISPENHEVQFDSRVYSGEGDIHWFHWVTRGVYDKKNVLVELQTVGHDITEQKKAESEIQKALREKEILLRELYHRTKNNMQVIISLLNMQSEYIDDNKTKTFINETMNRIRSMSLVHEGLYKSSDLSKINLKTYLHDLTSLLVKSYNVKDRVTVEYDMDDISVIIDMAMPLGLSANELISNALKHAFPDNTTGTISIKLKKSGSDIITLTITDNGIGVPDDFNFMKQNSMGLINTIALVEYQLNGSIDFRNQKGITCIITFNDNLYEPRV